MAAVRKLRIYKMLICGLNYQWEWSHLSGRISIQNVKLIISGRGWKANLARGPGGGGDAFWGNPLLKAPMSSSLLKHSLPCWLDGVSCLKTSCRILGRERTSKETQRKQKEKKKTKPKFSLNSGVTTAVFGSVCIVSLFQGDPLAFWAVLCLCWGTADYLYEWETARCLLKAKLEAGISML